MGENLSVAKRVGLLECVGTVDNMLLEGVSTGDVASFIQEDQGELKDVNIDTLKRTLQQRKQDLLVELEAKTRRVKHENGIEDEDEEPAPKTEIMQDFSKFTPAAFSRGIMQKERKCVDKMVEMEAHYLAQRERLGRMLIAEGQSGLFSEIVGEELSRGFSMAHKMSEIEIKMGLAEANIDAQGLMNFEGYSNHTAEVLAKPESRRKLVGIVERLERSGKIKAQADELKREAIGVVDTNGESVEEEEDTNKE